jgi:hypothetical protein
MPVTTPYDRMTSLAIELPQAPAPAANYVPTQVVPVGDGRVIVYVAGQIPRRADGVLFNWVV